MSGNNFIQSLESRTLFSTIGSSTVDPGDTLVDSKSIQMERENDNGTTSPDGTNAGGSSSTGRSRTSQSARARFLSAYELD